MGMLERSHGPIKESLKAALLDNAEYHQSKWIDHLPWVILGKNSAYQPDIKASAYQMLYGFEPSLPGQILNAANHQESVKELENLLQNQQKRVSLPAIQPSAHGKKEETSAGIAENVTHVYTKQHKALGLQPSFAGPFPIDQRLSRSTFKLKVGFKVSGEPIYEIRHLNDLKAAEPDSHVAEAVRAKKGRPKSSPDSSEKKKPNSWSASAEELNQLNEQINGGR